MTFMKGDRVFVKSIQRSGTINYARMSAPTYTEPEAYSVYLDHTLRASYGGTIVAANDVEPLTEK